MGKKEEMKQQVEQVLDEYLRPLVALHEGYVELADVDENTGTVYVRMEGACSGCPISFVTLRNGIEAILKEHLDWVRAVEAVNEPEEQDFNYTLE